MGCGSMLVREARPAPHRTSSLPAHCRHQRPGAPHTCYQDNSRWGRPPPAPQQASLVPALPRLRTEGPLFLQLLFVIPPGSPPTPTLPGWVNAPSAPPAPCTSLCPSAPRKREPRPFPLLSQSLSSSRSWERLLPLCCARWILPTAQEGLFILFQSRRLRLREVR